MRRHIIIVTFLAVVVVMTVSYLGFKKSVLAPAGPDVVTDDKDRIRVSYPLNGSTIKSPLILTGEARGNWYFEASFPITIVNWDGLIIAEGHAEAQSDWMTTEYVPFKAEVKFVKPECGGETSWCKRGAVILQKDNPSDLPEHDAAVEIRVTFE